MSLPNGGVGEITILSLIVALSILVWAEIDVHTNENTPEIVRLTDKITEEFKESRVKDKQNFKFQPIILRRGYRFK